MAGTPAVPDMRLELVPLPVSDVDRAKAFYDQAGFGNLHDTQVTETMRVVQLTPPGSSCAIVFGTGMGPITDMVPGSVRCPRPAAPTARTHHAGQCARGRKRRGRRRDDHPADRHVALRWMYTTAAVVILRPRGLEWFCLYFTFGWECLGGELGWLRRGRARPRR